MSDAQDLPSYESIYPIRSTSNTEGSRDIIASLLIDTKPITNHLGELLKKWFGTALHSGWLTTVLQLALFITWLVLEQICPNAPHDAEASKFKLSVLYNYLLFVVLGSFAVALLSKQVIETKINRRRQLSKREKDLKDYCELLPASCTWLYAILAICYRPH